MELDITKFSKWHKFDDIFGLEETKSPGVYVLAHWDSVQSKPKSFISKEIFYIGETTKQTIRARLRQFENSAFKEKSGHSGGWTYREKCKAVTKPPKNLYVSFRPEKSSGYKGVAIIKYIERGLLLNYVLKQSNKESPVCNKA